MKKNSLLTLLPLFLLFIFSNAQSDKNRWFFDAGLGAAWQHNSLPCDHMGQGLTIGFGKWFLQSEKSPVDIGVHLRYMTTHTYGLDTKPNRYNLNDAVNGTVYPAINYADSSHGFVYDNAFTKLNDLSLELMLGANSFLQKTKVHPYVFAGISGTSYQSYNNLLNADSAMYNYASLLVTNGNTSKSALRGLLDKSYETEAYYNQKPNTAFSWTIGAGVTYQISKSFALGAEYKFTQTNTPWLDGVDRNPQSFDVGFWSKVKNDHHHYLSAVLRIQFNKSDRTNNQPSSTHTTPVHEPTDGNSAAQTTTTKNTKIDPSIAKPGVRFTIPAQSPYAAAGKSMTVNAAAEGVTNKNEITVKLNGTTQNNFSFSASEKKISIPVTLITGTNMVSVTIKNANGTSTATTTITYSAPTSVSSGTTTTSTTEKDTKISTIPASNSGSSTSEPTKGNNASGTNPTSTSGSHTGTSQGASTGTLSTGNFGLPPVVTYINPSRSPYTSDILNYTVTATVTNVSLSSQVKVEIDGVSLSTFTWNPDTRTVSFPVTLDRTKTKTVKITGTNTYGTDNKSVQLKFTGS